MSSLTMPAEDLGKEQVLALVRERYGLEGQLERLSAEKDHIFRFASADSGSYLLKIAHPAEPEAAAAMQMRVLEHLEAAHPGAAVQKPVRTLDGKTYFRQAFKDAGELHNVRMVSYLSGTLLRYAPRSLPQNYNVGKALAEIGVALRTFDDPELHQHSVWDIQRLAKTAEWIEEVEDLDRRALLRRGFEQFQKYVEPRLHELRSQAIHGDMNVDNVLVSEQAPDVVSGLLDFGDMVHSQLVNDAAIGAAHLIGPGEHILDGPAAFVEGYASVTELNEIELDVLFDLVVARTVLRLTVSHWRAKRFPDNVGYILRHAESTWRQYEELLALSRAKASDLMIAAGRKGAACA